MTAPGRIVAEVRRPFAALVLASLLGCAPLSTMTPGEAPASESAALAATYAGLAREGGRSFTLDPDASTVRLFAFRAGRAGRLGHNHVLSAPAFAGFAYLPAAGTENGRFDLEFRLDQLAFDRPEIRAEYGPAFASELNAAQIASTREHMLGSENLEADRFPFVRIRSRQIVGEAPKFAALVGVELHGRTREMLIPLTVTGLPEPLRVSGSFVIRQTDFGARPYTVFGGLLAVHDEVVVEFNLVGR